MVPPQKLVLVHGALFRGNTAHTFIQMDETRCRSQVIKLEVLQYMFFHQNCFFTIST